MTGDQAIRPPTEQSGAPFAFDIGCLTPEQQALWEEHFGSLKRWARGSTWQVTLMELWSFTQICVLEAGGPPDYPPELQAEVEDLAQMLGDYLRNMRTGREPEPGTFF